MLPFRALLLASAAAALLAPAGALAGTPANLPQYQVGIDSQSLALTPGEIAGKQVFLGGFGLGGPNTVAGQGLGDRYATGNLGVGPSVRAISIGDGTNNFAIADIEAQGYFAANKDAPYGIEDMRKAVAAATNGKLPADHVVVQSDHTHGGPDFLGVWGGVPLEYRHRAFDQTVKAVVDAYNESQLPTNKGTLWYGTADSNAGENGPRLLNNQFDYDPANKVMDSDIRVLQARHGNGAAFATMLNFSAHADVLGSGNTLATGDWVQTTNPMLEKVFGGDAMTVVGTLGRTQPNRPGCANPEFKDEGDALCSLDTYSKLVVDRTQVAVDNAKPLTGKAEVVARSYMVTDPSNNAILLGLLYSNGVIGAPVNRAELPPWLNGNVLGTVTASARIGDVLLSSGPGEMYPQIPLKVRAAMEQIAAGARGYMTAGLANDQLGYLIAPLEAYPQPIWTSVLDNDFPNADRIGNLPATCQENFPSEDSLDNCNPGVSPIGNDNYFFNVSHSMGERVTCSLLRGAGEVFGRGSEAEDAYDRCAAFANDKALPEGSDVTLSDATKDRPDLPLTIPPGR